MQGLSCPGACGILPDWDQTCVLCIARRILNHWTTREALYWAFLQTTMMHRFTEQTPHPSPLIYYPPQSVRTEVLPSFLPALCVHVGTHAVASEHTVLQAALLIG